LNQFKPSNNTFNSSPSNCVDAIPPTKKAPTNSIPRQMNDSGNEMIGYGQPIPLVLEGFDPSFQEEVRRLQREDRAIKRYNDVMESKPGPNEVIEISCEDGVQEFEPQKKKSDIKKSNDESITEIEGYDGYEDYETEPEDNNAYKGDKPSKK